MRNSSTAFYCDDALFGNIAGSADTFSKPSECVRLSVSEAVPQTNRKSRDICQYTRRLPLRLAPYFTVVAEVDRPAGDVPLCQNVAPPKSRFAQTNYEVPAIRQSAAHPTQKIKPEVRELLTE